MATGSIKKLVADRGLRTLGRAVDWLFFTGPRAWMMCQPYCVFTGLEIPLSPIVKAAAEQMPQNPPRP